MEFSFQLKQFGFLYDFDFEFGMNTGPIRPQNLKELPNTFGLSVDSVAYVVRLLLFN